MCYTKGMRSLPPRCRVLRTLAPSLLLTTVGCGLDAAPVDSAGVATRSATFFLDASTQVQVGVLERDGERADAQEWWRPRAEGYEQGWNVAERPPGAGPIVVAVSTSSPVTADGADLRMGQWRIHAAAAWDRDGDLLPASLAPAAEGFVVTVDDTGADYPIVIDPLYSTVEWSAYGSARSEHFGSAVASGDLDGDGYDDLVVSASGASTGVGAYGEVYVYAGGASGPGTSPTTTLAGSTTRYGMGKALGVGDVDGDGYDDLLVKSESMASSTTRTVSLYDGGATGLSTTESWSQTDTTGSYLGSSIAVADFDGDGYADAALSEYAYTGAGRASVFLGPSFGSTADAYLTDSAAGMFSWGLQVVTDADGDGLPELAASDYTYDTVAYQPKGAVWVFPGDGSAGVSSAYAVKYIGAANDRLGWGIGDGGDVNGDGYGDLLVTRRKTSGMYQLEVYQGSAAGHAASVSTKVYDSSYSGFAGSSAAFCHLDADDDGYDDVVVSASTATDDVLLTYSGAAAGLSTTSPTSITLSTVAGWSSLMGIVPVGDVDGDGFAELAVSDSYNTGSAGSSLDVGWAGLFERRADDDGDGAWAGGGGTDCDDADAAAYPGAPEVVGDGIDQDCDGYDACYTDADGDGYGATTTVGSLDLDCSDVGEADNADDCDDGHATAHPGGTESAADGLDGDCDGKETCYRDNDHDSHGSSTTLTSGDTDCADVGEAGVADDCDDSAAGTYPGASETVADGVDQDCDGGDTCGTDLDGDGFGSTPLRASADLDCTDAAEADDVEDCDDGDAAVSPTAAEVVADGVDQDCDGGDTCYADADRDGEAGSAEITSVDLDCADAGEGDTVTDCNDGDAASHPGAGELPGDGADQDCDGADDCYEDVDGDGSGGVGVVAGNDMDCADAGEAATNDDCRDTDKSTHPGATETVADAYDQDCDGADACYIDLDGDGFGSDLLVDAADYDCTDVGEAAVSGDCDDLDRSRNPGVTEVAGNGTDENCDGADGCYEDLDGDGVGSAVIVECGGDAVTSGGDCDDTAVAVHPGASEHCNEADDDCDGEIDEDVADPTVWYRDADDDGWGVEEDTAASCDRPEGYVADAGDCEDADPEIHPKAFEDCEATTDLNCDGEVGAEDPDCDNGGSDTEEPSGDTGAGGTADGGLCGCLGGGSGSGAAGLLLGVGVAVAGRRKGR